MAFSTLTRPISFSFKRSATVVLFERSHKCAQASYRSSNVVLLMSSSSSTPARGFFQKANFLPSFKGSFVAKNVSSTKESKPQLNKLPFSTFFARKEEEQKTQPSHTKRKHNFMVCIDGSENAERALQMAKKLVQVDRGDHLYVVSIPPLIDVSPALGDDFLSSIREDRDKSVKGWIEKAESHCNDMRNHVTTIIGEPAGGPREALLDIAKKHDVDFIVLGSRGTSVLKKLLLGSVSNYIVNHAPCNVIVVK